jgi:hypothetical protein
MSRVKVPPITAASLLERREAALHDRGFDRRRMPIEAITAIDMTMPSRPLRSLRIDARAPVVVVSSVCKQPRFVERIDLLSPGANEHLAKYAVAL